MNPALLRFLNALKAKLRQSLDKITPDLKNISSVNALNNLLEGFIKNEDIDDKTAIEFITEFYKFQKSFQTFSKNNPSVASLATPQKAKALFDELENNEIYILNLLLHKNKGKQELNLSSFAEHFYHFLKCPFRVEFDHDQLKFILSYSDTDAVREKQHENNERFCRALSYLGIDHQIQTHFGGKEISITIPPNHVKDMLQLAQFELIDENNIPTEIPVLEKKFKNILVELIESEVSFSAQCGKLAGLLAAKLKSSEYKLTENERELLKKAQEYYQKIAGNPYPWFGEKFTAEQLKSMSFDEMLQLCHGLYEGLQINTAGKAEEIGKRLGIMRWASIHYAELNRLINDENRLNFPDEGSKESDKQIANQNLIPPVQRLPRIILLTGELVKCANVVAMIKPNEQNTGYLSELRALNEEWIRTAQNTNERVKKAEENSSDITSRIFSIFSKLTLQSQPIDLSATLLAQSVTTRFSHLRHFIKNPTSHDIENPSDNGSSLVEDDKLIIPPNFQDALTQSVIFAEGTVSISTPIDEKHADIPEFTLPMQQPIEDDETYENDWTIIVDQAKQNSTQSILRELGSLLLKKEEKSITEEEPDSSSGSFTLSEIGGLGAVFGGIVLIAAGVGLTLLQPHLFMLGIALIWEGCITVGIGAMLLKEKPAPIDYDKDPNRPYFFGIDVGKSSPGESPKPYLSLSNNPTPPVSDDDSYSDDDVPYKSKKAVKLN